jgi:26S proteasome regulatory subunit N3
MQFPPNAYRKYLETPEQRRERERQEEELAEELEKEDAEDM